MFSTIFPLKVVVDYKSGTRKFEIDTPVRRHAIKQLNRENYTTAISNLHAKIKPQETAEVSANVMVKEIQELCLLKDKSAFRELNDRVRKFS